MGEKESGLVDQCKQAPPRAKPVEKALDQAPVMTDDELEIHAAEDSGPFTPGLRIHCALQGFAQRKTEHCKGCHFFEGAATRIIHGATDDEIRGERRFARENILENPPNRIMAISNTTLDQYADMARDVRVLLGPVGPGSLPLPALLQILL